MIVDNLIVSSVDALNIQRLVVDNSSCALSVLFIDNILFLMPNSSRQVKVSSVSETSLFNSLCNANLV